MEEAVVGAVVGASIQVLLHNLLTISQEQINLFRDFKNDLETLKKSFFMVKDFLHDAEIRQVTDNAVKRWLRELEALAFDADNVFDEINYQLLSKKAKTTHKKPMKKKVQSFLSCFDNPIAYRLKLGRRIKDIIEKLKSINQQASEFGLQTRIAIAQAHVSGSNSSGSMETDSFTVDPFFYGREDDEKRIVGMLITTPIPAEQVLSVLPIVGMGGLGKTTLAREVLKDKQIKNHFETRVWVHVPRIFDVLVLLKNILTSLTTENVEYGNREALLKMLQNKLGAKKYLVVLDDVWNEDREKWDDFVKSFLGISSTTGNCMIVTTRCQEVASIVKTLPVHNLKSLSHGDCWSIIEAKAFKRSQDIPSEFETMGRNIAKRCQGMPLAAKVVGGLLRDKSKYEWLEIENNWLSDFRGENPISKILKLSFDNLSSPSLKKCFAYCSIFPKGYEIKKEKLIELWMAEGFFQIDQRNNINMETVGSKIFNILLHNSLLQVAKRDSFGNVIHCNMHDLVHDLACSILRENDNATDGVCHSRYIGCKPSGDGYLSISEGQEKYVRTLFFDGEIFNINFSDFESLRSLTLRGRDINELPASIRELKHLRYLDISETRIRYLPDSIGELYHMQTLRAHEEFGISYLEKLPDSLSNLISLRNLHISIDTTLPHGIGKLTSLQTLPFFHVGDEKGCTISELENLKDLKGELEIRNVEKVRDKYEAISAGLFQKKNIHKLRFIWGSRREVDEANDESVLEGLQPHSNLKSLGIFGFNGKRLPLWISKMAIQMDGYRWEVLENIMVIKIQYCSEVEEIPVLGHLPYLKSLSLDNLDNVSSIGTSFYNIKDCNKLRASHNGVCEIVVFPALERLELLNMRNLREWGEVGFPCTNEGDQTQLNKVRVFPRLEFLRVGRCMQLVRAPSHFPCLKELDIYDMESSLPMEQICGKLTSLESLSIENIVNGVDYIPNEIFSNNHNLLKLTINGCLNMTRLPCLRDGGASLKVLWINNCRSMRELPDDIHNLNALEEFHISGCKSLKSIPYLPSSGGGGGHESQKGFTSLRKIGIYSCGELTNLPIEMVESCVTSLERLSLNKLSSITNLGTVIGCLHRMPNLRELIIVQVPKFSIELPDNIGYLNTNNSMKRLVMGPSPSSSWDNISFNKVVGSMLLQFISLRELALYGMEHWECLPDNLQHHKALSHLRLSSFGIEALPEWLGNLSSLETLNLHSLRNLRHLPSKQAMLRLSKLTELYIRRCPLLLKDKRNNKNDSSDNEGPQIVDSECPKISHITTVVVDFPYHYP